MLTNQNLPDHTRAFIGVASRTWTTIFGPPSTLDKLWIHSPQLGLAPKLKLNAFSAVHAAHLPMLDMENIIGDSPMLTTPLTSRVRIVSSSTCNPFVASDLGTLLYEMILDVAQNTLRLTDTVQTIVSDLQRIGDVDLVVLGPTAHTSLVQGALREKYINVNLISEPEAPASAQELRSGSDLIAIVGMSGRFPGSDNIYDFWETLQKGKDLHEKAGHYYSRAVHGSRLQLHLIRSLCRDSTLMSIWIRTAL